MPADKIPFTIIGTPFSTFTRTITLGLHHKGLKFEQISTTPQSELALENHPFGYIPTLIIHHLGGKDVDIKLRESQAIARFIERIAPEPSLQLKSDADSTILEEKVWEFVSITASFGFPAVEVGIVKPRIKAIDGGAPNDSELRAQIKDGVLQLQRYLKVVEELMEPKGFVYGGKLTWADFFLYPLLADLQMVPEWQVVSERILDWMKIMNGLEAVRATTPDTFSVNARP